MQEFGGGENEITQVKKQVEILKKIAAADFLEDLELPNPKKLRLRRTASMISHGCMKAQ